MKFNKKEFLLLFIFSILFFPKILCMWAHSGIACFPSYPTLAILYSFYEAIYNIIFRPFRNTNFIEDVWWELKGEYSLLDLVILLSSVLIIIVVFNSFRQKINFISKSLIFKIFTYAILLVLILVISSIPYYIMGRLVPTGGIE